MSASFRDAFGVLGTSVLALSAIRVAGGDICQRTLMSHLSRHLVRLGDASGRAICTTFRLRAAACKRAVAPRCDDDLHVHMSAQ